MSFRSIRSLIKSSESVIRSCICREIQLRTAILPIYCLRILEQSFQFPNLYYSLYPIKLLCSSYPEGNLGVNQLLDCSINLSSISSGQKIDLHFRTLQSSTRVSDGFAFLMHSFSILQVPICINSLTQPLPQSSSFCTDVGLFGPCFKTHLRHAFQPALKAIAPLG